MQCVLPPLLSHRSALAATSSTGIAGTFFQQAEKDIPLLLEHIALGNMQPLLTWLRNNVHQYGQLYTAEELCTRITGEKLNFKYFMDYARNKYNAIYNM